jgi:hypothetical protein
MPVVKQDQIRRRDLLDNQDTLYVFGDNMVRRGFGGQAREMRGEPNAVGIPTKWAPTMMDSDMFRDADLPKIKPTLDAELDRLRDHLKKGGTVVIPSGGIGTGLANLKVNAPAIFWYINENLRALERVVC